jgi:hypothetical protein
MYHRTLSTKARLICLGIEPPPANRAASPFVGRQFSALSFGASTRTDRLNECEDTLAEILGIDSLDLVELVMAVEEKGMGVETVGDLMRFLDEMNED